MVSSPVVHFLEIDLCYDTGMVTHAPLFDTHQVIERLITSGNFEKEQAEAIAEAVNAGLSGGVATKADLRIMQADLEKTLTVRGVSALVVLFGLITAVITALKLYG